ncbi:hypothetical protein ANO11243_048810 [Dothideomycetidae sp. 11243]|nr:hypothetical protein ANO11243_048810 [fungal sp. No.11243]
MAPKRKAGSTTKPPAKRHPFPTQAQIDLGTAVYKKAGAHTIYERKYYTRGKFYIIDDQAISTNAHSASNVTWMRNAVVGVHAQKCMAVRECLSHASPYQLVQIPTFSNATAWDAFWDQEVRSWTSGELILIYYHGSAGCNGRRYTWHLSQSDIDVNAFEFMSMLIDSGKDLMFILEAYLPTRFLHKFELRKSVRGTGNAVEVFATGRPGQVDDYSTTENEFTNKLLQVFFDLIHGTDDLRRRSTKAWSIAELLRSDREIDNNPLKLNLQPMTNPDDLIKIIESDSAPDTKVYRILLDRHHVRAEGQLIFCRDTVEDTARERTLRQNRERRGRFHSRDEGFVDSDGDDDDCAVETRTSVEEPDRSRRATSIFY